MSGSEWEEILRREIKEPKWLSYIKSKGYSTEEALKIRLTDYIIRNLAESEFSEKLFFVQGIPNNNGRISYYFPDDVEHNDEEFLNMKRQGLQFAEKILLFLKGAGKDIYQIEGTVSESDDNFEINLCGTVEKMYSAVRIKLIPFRASKSDSEKTDFALISEGGETVPVHTFPVECILSEDIAKIMFKLELMYDMETYDEFFFLTGKYSIDGMKLSLRLTKVLEEKKILVSESRMNLIRSYKSNKNLMKKWKKYEKQKSEKVEWEKVIGRVVDFLDPVWERLIANELYTGDWMPELGRYLA